MPCVRSKVGHDLVLGWPGSDCGYQETEIKVDNEIQPYEWDEGKQDCHSSDWMQLHGRTG